MQCSVHPLENIRAGSAHAAQSAITGGTVPMDILPISDRLMVIAHALLWWGVEYKLLLRVQ